MEEVRRRVSPRLRDELLAAGFAMGDPIFIRIFKETRETEIWLRPRGASRFRMFRNYPAIFSGRLGPKLEEGDHQAPEGFYRVGADALNPESDCHLSFNVGFPNEFDAGLGRTGSWIMMHGRDQSVGCFAMTDPVIEEIYLLAESALIAGQGEFFVHVFPFRMTDGRMKAAVGEEWFLFWENLRQGFDQFEKTKVPPVVRVENQKYVLDR
ncbi:MAG: 2-dehydro-3-deoxyphosphooctonate aldolase [Verrucomicrobia bacterium]|nr:2-dehydro-3-deoxyphosphooctonate aldolase [Verrucomicrobiota bacterium]